MNKTIAGILFALATGCTGAQGGEPVSLDRVEFLSACEEVAAASCLGSESCEQNFVGECCVYISACPGDILASTLDACIDGLAVTDLENPPANPSVTNDCRAFLGGNLTFNK